MNDLIVKIEKLTRKVELEQIYIGNDHENLQEKLVFQFDTFVNGQGRLEYEINGTKNYIVLTKEEETYTIPVQNVITIYQSDTMGKIKFQLVITEGTAEENIPVFKSNIFYLKCRPSINAVSQAPEGYDLWIEQANAILNEMDNIDLDIVTEDDETKVVITRKDGTEKESVVTSNYDDTEIRELIAEKQDELISGTNIKTINNESILGSGNIVIQGGGGGETSNYEDLENKPSINNVELLGNKSLNDLGIINFSGDYNDLTNKPTIDDYIHVGSSEPTDDSSIWIDTDDADVSIPSKTSELVNDSGFIDNSVNTLQNYYNKMNMDKMLEDIWDMLGGSLPVGYTKVEYLQGNGNQYIDLGFIPHTGIVAKGKYTGFTQPMPLGISTPMGVMSSSTNRFDMFSFGSTTIEGTMTQVFGLGYVSYHFTNTPIEQGKVYEVESALKDGEQYLKVDGNTIFTNNVSGSIEATANMLLFNRYKNGSLDIGWYEGKIYYVKIWQDNVLIRDMIPCLDNNNVPCFYDRVNKQTYYNQGTGEFIYGQVEIPSSYTRCKYIESSGTQYIDTGIIATINTGIDINYSYNQIDSNTNAGLCGIYKGTTPREDTLFISTSSGKTDSAVCLFSRGNTLSTGTTLTANIMYNAKINWLNNSNLNFENGSSVGTVGENGVTSRNIILFGRDSSGTYALTKARIYSCKFSENNTITHHFIPCLDTNNVPCFYDTITKQTYYNEGTGTFTYEVL